MNEIDKLQKLVIDFRDKRDWKQFHNPKDLALSLLLESAEVLEIFQWKTEKQMEKYIKANKEKLGEELSDVLYWILLLSNDLKINLPKAFRKKMRENNKKYPVSKSKGNAKKYTILAKE